MGKIADWTPPPPIFADRLSPHLSCKFFHFEAYVPKAAKGLVWGGGQKIEEFFANEEIDEMRFSLRTRRTREEFHANEEIEEMLGQMFPIWPKGRS